MIVEAIDGSTLQIRSFFVWAASQTETPKILSKVSQLNKHRDLHSQLRMIISDKRTVIFITTLFLHRCLQLSSPDRFRLHLKSFFLHCRQLPSRVVLRVILEHVNAIHNSVNQIEFSFFSTTRKANECSWCMQPQEMILQISDEKFIAFLLRIECAHGNRPFAGRDETDRTRKFSIF